jgi:hypothetical protein
MQCDAHFSVSDTAVGLWDASQLPRAASAQRRVKALRFGNGAMAPAGHTRLGAGSLALGHGHH